MKGGTDQEAMRFYSAMAEIRLLYIHPLPSLKLPSNTFADSTKVLIVKALEQAQVMSTTQTFRETFDGLVQYTGVCKQNIQGTNAWLWYMCNSSSHIFIQYELHLPFSCIRF